MLLYFLPTLYYNFKNLYFATFTSFFQKDIRLHMYVFYINTAELHLSGLIGTASHPDMQKIRIIGLSFENRLHWQCEVRLFMFTVRTRV